MHTLGAFAVITNAEGHVLLCHRTDLEAWNLPGGRVEVGETPWQAVVREVEEEVGLVVEATELVGIYSVPSRADLVFTFRCSKFSGEPRLSNEANQIAWFAPSVLPFSTLRRHVERIHDALVKHNSVLLKSQA
jgi:mutator protein MutT